MTLPRLWWHSHDCAWLRWHLRGCGDTSTGACVRHGVNLCMMLFFVSCLWQLALSCRQQLWKQWLMDSQAWLTLPPSAMFDFPVIQQVRRIAVAWHVHSAGSMHHPPCDQFSMHISPCVLLQKREAPKVTDLLSLRQKALMLPRLDTRSSDVSGMPTHNNVNTPAHPSWQLNRVCVNACVASRGVAANLVYTVQGVCSTISMHLKSTVKWRASVRDLLSGCRVGRRGSLSDVAALIAEGEKQLVRRREGLT